MIASKANASLRTKGHAFHRTPRVSHGARPSVSVKVAIPERFSDAQLVEKARLMKSDAFAELVSLNKQKQSVNRPQKVMHYKTHRVVCMHFIF